MQTISLITQRTLQERELLRKKWNSIGADFPGTCMSVLGSLADIQVKSFSLKIWTGSTQYFPPRTSLR